jgi:hypothetical protein
MLDHKPASVNPHTTSNHPIQLHPLFDAVGNRHTALIAQLIDRGADVNARQPATECHSFAPQRRFIVIEKGSTPLHLAAILNDLDTVVMLLERGANCPGVRNNSGLLPADVTRSGVIRERLRDEERRREHRFKRIPAADLVPRVIEQGEGGEGGEGEGVEEDEDESESDSDSDDSVDEEGNGEDD